MPTIRGKFIAEMEKGMPLRRAFKILLWLDRLSGREWRLLEDLDRLRLYLSRELDGPCRIRLMVTDTHTTLLGQAANLRLDVEVVTSVPMSETLHAGLDNESIRSAVSVGLANDADCIVVPNELLPYLELVEEHSHMLLTDASFLLKYVEVFVRGHGLAWAFSHPVLNQSFSTFYQFAELVQTFQPGFELQYLLRSPAQDSETIEAGRTLFNNRLMNICFTRDQLLFFAQQREAAFARRQEDSPSRLNCPITSTSTICCSMEHLITPPS